MGLGVAVGVGIGVGVSIGFGVAIGVGVGVTFAQATTDKTMTITKPTAINHFILLLLVIPRLSFCNPVPPFLSVVLGFSPPSL